LKTVTKTGRTVADAIASLLRGRKVSSIFGIPGGKAISLIEACHREGLNIYSARHEESAGFMASGYAQATQSIGVVYGQGPGVTNFVTAAAAARVDSVPLVIFGVQVSRSKFCSWGHQENTNAFMGIDSLRTFESICHYCVRPPDAASLLRSVRLALNIAVQKSGPCFIDIYSDLFAGEVSGLENFEQFAPSYQRSVDELGLRNISSRLVQAKLPAFVAGSGLAHTGASEFVTELCEKYQMGCVTSDYAKGIISEDHPLALGTLGRNPHRSALELLHEADVILVAGAKFGECLAMPNTQEIFAKSIHIGRDFSEISLDKNILFSCIGDVAESISQLVKMGPKVDGKRGMPLKLADIQNNRKTNEALPISSGHGELTYRTILSTLREVLPADCLVVADTGTSAAAVKKYFPVLRKDGFFCLYGIACMGSGLPLAMGVQIATPGSRTVAIMGDGGFLVHGTELNAAAHYSISPIVIIINNGGFKSIADGQRKFTGNTVGTLFDPGNLSMCAKSFGCHGFEVENQSGLVDALKFALKHSDKPCVLDVKINQSETIFDFLSEDIEKQYSSLVRPD
jgi:acetolactate synthase I/II/III large subunit